MSVQSPLTRNQASQSYTITQADLPLFCPMSNVPSWDSHPRIHLPIAKTGYITCPYCNAAYYLT